MTTSGSLAGPTGNDDHARHHIVASLDQTLFVEAGAGTGKTTQLVGRMVALVVRGYARIENIAAITFTEAAASELSDRVSESLERIAAGTLDAYDPLATVMDSLADNERAAARELAKAALESLDRAAITTLHGFARRILSEHSFEAGLPPVFEVFDELRSEVEFDRRWDRFVRRILGDGQLDDSLVRATICRVGLDHLRAIARQFDQSQDLLVDVAITAPPLGEVSVSEVVEALGNAAAMCAFCTDGEDKLFRHVQGLTGFIVRLGEANGDVEHLMLLADAPKLANSQGRRENWGGMVGEVREWLARAEQARLEVLSRAGGDALAVLMGEIRSFTLDSAAERRSAGQLGFHDLLVQARQLVRTSAGVRAILHGQYRYLLIDEFQDTDPIQAELAMRIAGGNREPEGGRWWEIQAEAGRLFFVGDPKQSIYRFRRADISLYLDAQRRFCSGAQYLLRNHRSVPGILAWVNAIFGRLIGEGDPDGQPAYVGLGEHRDAHSDTSDRPPVIILGGAVSENVETVRRTEAAGIASAIRCVREEGWPVGDSGRPARFEDICILIPSRTALPALEDGLDRAGIPYRLEASTLVYGSGEIREVLTVLAAVDDPTDQLSVVGALRSSIFACGDDDLLRFRSAGGSWDYRNGIPGALRSDHPVAEAMGELREMHEQRFWIEPAGLIEALGRRRMLLAAALDGPRFRESWRRFHFVADQARWYNEAVGGSLRDYLAWTDLQSEEGARVDEAVLPETDDDAVRIMTIHKSKGLEFPVVVLAGLNTQPPAPRGPRVLWGSEGAEVKVNQHARTSGFDGLAAREERLDRFELIRLLYVAATRARDHLIVSLHHKSGTDCLAARLASLCDELPDLCRQWEPPEPQSSTGDVPVGGEEVPIPDLLHARQAWSAEREQRLGQARVPRVLTATAISELAHRHVSQAPPAGGKRPFSLNRDGQKGDASPASWDEEIAVPWRRGRSGTAVGRAVHGVLQVIDLNSGSGIETLSQSQAAAEGIGERSAEVTRLVRSALDSPLIREAVGRRYWREVYVGASVGWRAIEGFVDLLVEEGEGYHVVDYKTGAGWDGGDLDRAVSRYRPQGAAYALAVEAALGHPVTRCTFLFVGGPGVEAVARPIEDLASAMEEVRALVTAPPSATPH